ncbi:MAG: hypothetical protein COA82_07820 [Alkaliphilus sp.]|nr:hypothetical protein [bacterium AH-315-L21]MBN4067595.1 hypothetical protein [Alkaliphilus transvaalensis]PHS33888.1 MAG: hypothetical protein COA82_07820 [Alkaliphilus sp.]
MRKRMVAVLMLVSTLILISGCIAETEKSSESINDGVTKETKTSVEMKESSMNTKSSEEVRRDIEEFLQEHYDNVVKGNVEKVLQQFVNYETLVDDPLLRLRETIQEELTLISEENLKSLDFSINIIAEISDNIYEVHFFEKAISEDGEIYFSEFIRFLTYYEDEMKSYFLGLTGEMMVVYEYTSYETSESFSMDTFYLYETANGVYLHLEVENWAEENISLGWVDSFDLVFEFKDGSFISFNMPEMQIDKDMKAIFTVRAANKAYATFIEELNFIYASEVRALGDGNIPNLGDEGINVLLYLAEDAPISFEEKHSLLNQ